VSIAEPFRWKVSDPKVFKNDPSAEWLAHERARIECRAVDNEITDDIQKRAGGDWFDFRFPDALTFRRFQEAAYNDHERTTGDFSHTERFLKEETEFHNAWTDYAARAMNELGIPSIIEIDGTASRFAFDTEEDQALLAYLQDIGMFRRWSTIPRSSSLENLRGLQTTASLRRKSRSVYPPRSAHVKSSGASKPSTTESLPRKKSRSGLNLRVRAHTHVLQTPLL
jgi:hypothetical protein